jgi:hypothetical protein
LGSDNDETKDEAEDQHNGVPPPRNFLVVFDHVCVVAIIVPPRFCALECLDHVPAPEENAVGNKGANLGYDEPLSAEHKRDQSG